MDEWDGVTGEPVALFALGAEAFEVAARGDAALTGGDHVELPEQGELGLQPRAVLLEAVGEVAIDHAAPRMASAGAEAMLSQLSRSVSSTRTASSSGPTALSLVASRMRRLTNP